jgi:phosphopantetheine adenylyltransferase
MLLLYTVLHAKYTVFIGVTGENMLVNKKYKEVLQSLPVRMNKVR